MLGSVCQFRLTLRRRWTGAGRLMAMFSPDTFVFWRRRRGGLPGDLWVLPLVRAMKSAVSLSDVHGIFSGREAEPVLFSD